MGAQILKLRSFPGETCNWPPTPGGREKQRAKRAAPEWWFAALASNLRGWSWAGKARPPHARAPEAFAGSVTSRWPPHTFPSEAGGPETAGRVGEACLPSTGRSEEPPVARVQFVGHPVRDLRRSWNQRIRNGASPRGRASPVKRNGGARPKIERPESSLGPRRVTELLSAFSSGRRALVSF